MGSSRGSGGRTTYTVLHKVVIFAAGSLYGQLWIS
jgi:hypothetical protein